MAAQAANRRPGEPGPQLSPLLADDDMPEDDFSIGEWMSVCMYDDKWCAYQRNASHVHENAYVVYISHVLFR